MWSIDFASRHRVELCRLIAFLFSLLEQIASVDVSILGTLVGISNSLGTIPGFVGPYVVGAITDKNVS